MGDGSDLDLSSQSSSVDFSSDISEAACLSDLSELSVEDEVGEVDPISEPLYEGSDITTTISNILIMTYAKKYNLTQDGFRALIDLIRVHCPKENNCVTSVFKLKSFFCGVLDDDGFQPKQFKYCSVCQGQVPSNETTCGVKGCPGQRQPLIQFDYIPIKHQLRKLFQG